MDVSIITEECNTIPVTNCDLAWRGIKRRLASGGRVSAAVGESGEDEETEDSDNEAEAVVISNSRVFSEWLRARPERTIWVATHQVRLIPCLFALPY